MKTGPQRRRRHPVQERAAVESESTPSLAASEVRRLVRDELRALLARLVDDTDVYSTRAGCAPPGYGRDAWRALAHRLGVRRGRYWVVSAAALAAHERGLAAPPEPSTPPPTNAERWHPRMIADALGLRVVR